MSEPRIGRTGLVHTEPLYGELVDSINRQIRAHRPKRFQPRHIVRKRSPKAAEASSAPEAPECSTREDHTGKGEGGVEPGHRHQDSPSTG